MITKYTNLNIAGTLIGSAVVGTNVIAYDRFDSQVYLINYETGFVNKTAYEVQKRNTNERFNALPFFYDGSNLYVLCDRNDRILDPSTGQNKYCIQNFNTGAYLDISEAVMNEFKFWDSPTYCTYGRYEGADNIYCIIRDTNGKWNLKSYNIHSKDINTLQSNILISHFIDGILFKDNTLYWFIEKKCTSFNLATNAVTYLHLDLSHYLYQDKPIYLLTSSNEIMMIHRNTMGNDVAIKINNYAAMILGPYQTVQHINIKITSGLLIQDIMGGIYYKFQGNQLTTYVDMLNDDFICSNSIYLQLGDGLVYTKKELKEFATSSPGMSAVYMESAEFLRVLPETTKLPTCMPKLGLLVDAAFSTSKIEVLIGSKSSDVVKFSIRQGYPFTYFNLTSGTVLSSSNQPFIEVDTRFRLNQFGYLVKVNVNDPLDYSKSVPVFGKTWDDDMLAVIDENKVIYGFKDTFIIYDMSTLQAIYYFKMNDIFSHCSSLCQSVGQEFDDVTGLKNTQEGLVMSILCYDDSGNSDDMSFIVKVSLYESL